MPYHKILEKQIQELLPAAYLKDTIISNFLAVVSNCYSTFEKEKNISEQALKTSEEEYEMINRDLQLQNEIKKESVIKLNEVIKELDADAFPIASEGDLMTTIRYLEEQIKKTKQLKLELIQAKEEAEKATRAKSDFLSVMSHEIRTPLNAIVGSILLLQQQNPQPDQKEFLHILEVSSDNLLSLINDILDFGKLEAGKIEFAERDINLLHFTRNIKMANDLKAGEKGNHILLLMDENLPEIVRGDDIRLGQILNNLISNALKFTQHGTITLHVSVQKSTAENVLLYFSVEDNGIGIPEEKQQMIFERFTQAHTYITRDSGGPGLGLTIVRRLLQLQGSDIFVESTQGKGSKFYFILSFKKSKTVVTIEKPFQKTGKQDLKGIRILLVEDVAFNIMIADSMLQNWNARVEIAENGAIAVEKMKRETYDIVLMDIQMPVMDGYTATSEIRKFDTQTPIIALTASVSIDIQGKANTVGMNGFITKPFNPNDLFAVLYAHTIGKSITEEDA